MSHKLTISDKIIAKTVLPFIPQFVTPNSISWARLFSVPFVAYFLWVENYSVAFPLFALSAFSDAVDGALARTRNLVTSFGKMFDPLADKLLIAVAALIIIPRYLDLGIVVVMVAVDLILIMSAYLHKNFYGKVIQAENSGKIKMVLQSIGLAILILYALTSIPVLLIIAQYLFYMAIFFALVSLIVYRAI